MADCVEPPEGGIVRTKRRQVADLLATPRAEKAYEAELLFGRVMEQVQALLLTAGSRQRDLARRLGVSEGRVSQLLSGAENMTLKTLAGIGWALGVRFRIVVEPIDSSVRLADALYDGDTHRASIRRGKVGLPSFRQVEDRDDSVRVPQPT